MAKQPSEPAAEAEHNTPIHPSFTTTSTEHAQDVYREAAEDAEVEDLLTNSDLFDPESRTWLFPKGTTTEEALVKSVYKIVSSIVERFVQPSQDGVSRTLINVHGVRGNKIKDEDGYPPYPDLVVRASGPSFEDPIPAKDGGSATAMCSIAFSNVASFFAVKLDAEVGTAKHNVREMEKYARFIFAQQPNRLYVRCLVITEKHARLVHFDRAGAQVTPLIDIHQHPATFVRLIAGLASVNERLLGLDDSIQWTIVDGRKAQGTLTTTAAGGTIKAHPIVDQIPIPRETFRGRGTTCWRVRDPDTSEELVVKDSWRPDDRPSEHEFLKLFEDLPGVVHMVSYETGRGETKDYRCASTMGQYANRAAMRTMMKSYGKSVEFFTSVLQLLCAIRDAIAGHQRLLNDELRILHRDISHNNILLGGEGARQGYKGILIDLEMSFRATNDQPTVNADYNVGTRIFQSLSVLGSYVPQYAIPAHDHLDDLESFFYVIVYMFLIHRPDGTRVSGKEEGPSIVGKWDDDDPSIAYRHKRGIFGGSTDGLTAFEVVQRTWGPACTAFYKKFRSWMSNVRQGKFELLLRSQSRDEDEDESEDEDSETLDALLSRRDEHYSQVLSIFDEAIEAIKASTTDEAHVSLAPLDEAVDVDAGHTTEEGPTVVPPTGVPSRSGAEQSEPSPPSPTVENQSPEASSGVGTAASTPSSSLEAPVPTTPPPAAPSTFAVYSNPASPRLKRRSEDGVHPESPPSKGRRVSEGLLVTAHSP